jgi:hypothetical protein
VLCPIYPGGGSAGDLKYLARGNQLPARVKARSNQNHDASAASGAAATLPTSSSRSNRVLGRFAHPPPLCPASVNRNHQRTLQFRLLHLRQSWCKISRLNGIPRRSLPYRQPSLSPSVLHPAISVARPAMILLLEGGTRAGKQRTMRPRLPSKSPRNLPICSFR